MKIDDEYTNLEDMVDITTPKENENLQFNDIVINEIDDFIFSYLKRNKLHSVGIQYNNNLLLKGEPGTGKTSLARHISQKTGLPLITVRLDELITSRLGGTSKNIHTVFDYSSKKLSILFLDEFDAVAKNRDVREESGELKRVVNSILQNIDAFNNDSILIVATNYEKILDKAVVRRFDKTIKLELPNKTIRNKLILQYSKILETDFSKYSKKLEKLVELTEGYSPADLKTVIMSASKKILLRNEDILTYSQILYEIFLKNQIEEYSIEEAMKFLTSNKIPQKEIEKILRLH